MPREPYVDTDAVAEYLGVSRRTLEVWVQRRRIPFHKVGRLVRFRLSEVDAWIAETTEQATADPVRHRRHVRSVS